MHVIVFYNKLWECICTLVGYIIVKYLDQSAVLSSVLVQPYLKYSSVPGLASTASWTWSQAWWWEKWTRMCDEREYYRWQVPLYMLSRRMMQRSRDGDNTQDCKVDEKTGRLEKYEGYTRGKTKIKLEKTKEEKITM